MAHQKYSSFGVKFHKRSTPVPICIKSKFVRCQILVWVIWNANTVLSDFPSLYAVHCSLYAVKFSLYAVLCLLYAVLCPTYVVLFTLSAVLLSLYAVLSLLFVVLSSLYVVLWSLYEVLVILYAVLLSLYAVLSSYCGWGRDSTGNWVRAYKNLQCNGCRGSAILFPGLERTSWIQF